MVDVPLKDTLNKKWKDDKGGFGFKMLQKMGWKENTGLGKDEGGDVNFIHIKKREEALGLGCESIGNRANNNWGTTATSYANVLEALKANYSGGDKDESSKSKKKSSKKGKDKEKSAKSSKKSKESGTKAVITAGMKYKKKSAARDFAAKSAVDKVAVLGHSSTSELINKKLALTSDGISSGSIAATYKFENIDDSKPRTRSNSTLSEPASDDEGSGRKSEHERKASKKEKKSKKDRK